jgi:hypothetical protein
MDFTRSHRTLACFDDPSRSFVARPQGSSVDVWKGFLKQDAGASTVDSSLMGNPHLPTWRSDCGGTQSRILRCARTAQRAGTSPGRPAGQVVAKRRLKSAAARRTRRARIRTWRGTGSRNGEPAAGKTASPVEERLERVCPCEWRWPRDFAETANQRCRRGNQTGKARLWPARSSLASGQADALRLDWTGLAEYASNRAAIAGLWRQGH